MKNYVEMSSNQINDLAYKIAKKVNKKHKYNWAQLSKIEKEKCYKLIMNKINVTEKQAHIIFNNPDSNIRKTLLHNIGNIEDIKYDEALSLCQNKTLNFLWIKAFLWIFIGLFMFIIIILLFEGFNPNQLILYILIILLIISLICFRREYYFYYLDFNDLKNDKVISKKVTIIKIRPIQEPRYKSRFYKTIALLLHCIDENNNTIRLIHSLDGTFVNINRKYIRENEKRLLRKFNVDYLEKTKIIVNTNFKI